ncbi:hypothetical protein OL548_14220 [Lysinibacillus sp. MHQ-1]|nr:hypothetical protein OL548_14220 [Lysinibacillus sp. MHQ-1]
MAFTVKTEAEKIFTNLMGTGASRLPTDPVGADNRANFHGIFENNPAPTSELQIQRAGSQLLFFNCTLPKCINIYGSNQRISTYSPNFK